MQRILFFLSLLPCCLAAQSSVQAGLDALARDPALKHASLSACVIDVASGKVIAAYEADRSLSPASTQKLVTTATALAKLGSDYTFRTELAYDGEIGERGVLSGNLYLTGAGDPSLGSDQLEQTADLPDLMERLRLAVQQQGIRRIEGYVVGDASRWGTAATGNTWQWNDLGNYYAAGAWALNVHENLYYLHFQQTPTVGKSPRIAEIEPVVPELSFLNEVTTAGPRTGDNAYIYGAPYTYLRYVRGTIPAGRGRFTIKGSLPDPPLFAAQQLADQLLTVGIVTTAGPTTLSELANQGFQPQRRQVLYTHTSPPLRDIVYRTNQKSVNLYAEALLRTLGKEIKNEGSDRAGIEVIYDYWKQQGAPLGGVFLEDGSGLSADNGLTTRFLATLLRNSARDQRVFDALLPSLPEINGARVRAKSGTLARVRSYAGYATTPSGRQLAFAIIVNRFEGSGGAMRRKLMAWMERLD